MCNHAAKIDGGCAKIWGKQLYSWQDFTIFDSRQTRTPDYWNIVLGRLFTVCLQPICKWLIITPASPRHRPPSSRASKLSFNGPLGPTDWLKGVCHERQAPFFLGWNKEKEDGSTVFQTSNRARCCKLLLVSLLCSRHTKRCSQKGLTFQALCPHRHLEAIFMWCWFEKVLLLPLD